MCQIISYLSSWPRFWIGVINSRGLENVSPPFASAWGKGEEERQACGSLWRSLRSPTQIPAWTSPGRGLLQSFPVRGWETDSSGRGSKSRRHRFHLSASWVQSFSSLPLPFFDPPHSLFPSLINFLFLYQSSSVIFSPLIPPPLFL